MIAYPQSTNFHFYRSYHQDPYNKAIHLICIPMLSLCFLNFASIIKADRALLLFYSGYYLSLSLKVGIVMTIYLVGLYKFAKSFRFVVPKVASCCLGVRITRVKSTALAILWKSSYIVVYNYRMAIDQYFTSH